MKQPVIYIMVPCFNEEEVLPESVPVLSDTLETLIRENTAAPESRLLFVDDGSSDGTWSLLESFYEKNPLVCALKLRQNRGHQNACMAGMITAARFADAVVTIDADLQDDPGVIGEMVKKYAAGCGVVCGVRRSRKSDTFMKRVTARGFYLLVKLGGAKVVFDHADFRLMSREAVERLTCFGTEDLFLRGLVTRLGLPLDKVYYDRTPRLAGESKYSLKKMLHLARRGFESGRAKMADAPQLGELYIEKELLQ